MSDGRRPAGAPDPEPEAALVAACADGDPVAWERFVARYGTLVAALARRMLTRRAGRVGDADVDEVVSAVWFALLREDRKLLRRYRPEFRVSTYLGVIARTEVGRHLRRAAARPASLSTDAEAGGGPPADPRAASPLRDLVRRERDAAVAALRAALEALPPRDRLLLTLRFLEGLDYGRIADVLGVRRDSLGQWLHRAKARLAQAVPDLARWVEHDDP